MLISWGGQFWGSMDRQSELAVPDRVVSGISHQHAPPAHPVHHSAGASLLDQNEAGPAASRRQGG